MKKQMTRYLAILTVFGLGVAPSLAGEQRQILTEARPRPELGMGYKFGRGAVNVLTFWTEVPRNVAIEWQRTDPASGFFLGVGKGVGYGFARLMGGIYDMVSFPFPVPLGFAPVMDPEFSVHNQYSGSESPQYFVEVLDPEGVGPSHRPDTHYRDNRYPGSYPQDNRYPGSYHQDTQTDAHSHSYSDRRAGAYSDSRSGTYSDLRAGTRSRSTIVAPSRQWP